MDGVILYKNKTVILSPTKSNGTRHTAFCSSRCLPHDFQCGILCLGRHNTGYCKHEDRCWSCNEHAPTQLAPRLPFRNQCTLSVRRLPQLQGGSYVVVVDRYSGWPIVEQSRDGSSGLLKCLHDMFVKCDTADEGSSDGGFEFTTEETQQCCQSRVSIIASCLLGFPIQTVPPSSGSRHASVSLGITLAELQDQPRPF